MIRSESREIENIVILDGGYASYAYEYDLFSKAGYQLIFYNGNPSDSSAKYQFAGDAVGLLVRGTEIGGEALERMPRLRAIVRYGVGFDNIDLKAASEKGVRVANVQGYANHAVSDHALGLLFACVRNTGRFDTEGFGKPYRKEVFELHEKTLGIIGIGRIGSTFSKKAAPLFKRTIAFDPYKDHGYISACNAEKVEMDEVLRESDVISLHCNLTGETRHMIHSETIRRMERKPLIINTARGPVIREEDLLEALDNGLLHSAGLDVFEQEPPTGSQQKLISHPRVVATPHIAWHSDRAIEELQKRAADNLLALLDGRSIPDELGPGNG
jgi:D-3-phosphoglycerate dehydrogenase